MRTWTVQTDEMKVQGVPTLDEALTIALRLKRGGVDAKVRVRWGRKCTTCYGFGFVWEETDTGVREAACTRCRGGVFPYRWKTVLAVIVGIVIALAPPGWWMGGHW